MLCNCDKGLLAITKLPRTHWMVVIHVTVTSVVSVIGVITQYMSQVWCQKQVSEAGIRNCIPQKFCKIHYLDIYVILWDTISYPCLLTRIWGSIQTQHRKMRPNAVTLQLFSSKSSNHDRRPATIDVSFEFKVWPMFELDSFWLLHNTILHWAVLYRQHMKYVYIYM